MNEQDLKNLWQSELNTGQIRLDLEQLIADIDSTSGNVRSRDLREIIVALVLIPVFGFTLFVLPHYLSQIGSGIILIWCIFLVFKLLGTKKKVHPAATASLLDYLKDVKAFLQAQKQLLESVVYWYILPPTIGLLLFFGGFDLSTAQQIRYGTIVLAVAVSVYLLNRLAVKKALLPQLKKVDTLLDELNS